MTISSIIRIAALGAAAMVAAILAIAIPRQLWSNESLVTAGLLLCSLLFPAFVRMSTIGKTSSDAAVMFLLGPLGMLCGSLLVLSGGAFAFGLVGMTKMSRITAVVWCGDLLIGYCFLHVASAMVSQAAAQTSRAADDDRALWTATLCRLAAQCPRDITRIQLERFTERVRYSANDPVRTRVRQNNEISMLLTRLEQALEKPDEFQPLLRSAENLLEQRELALKNVRAEA